MSMAESKIPAKIRVAQDADGFWTCREAASGSPEFIRADLVEPLVEALRECRTSICGYAITDSAQYPEVLFRINNELQRIDKRIRAALSSWEAGQ